ncbi:MAG: arsenate reductase ArsC [Deltaproteobacteria bacterium]|nr:arsenate reductase ArsC [Deltaproteobacteria bacterium]
MKIAFICTGNICRSQMAEGIARHFLLPSSKGVGKGEGGIFSAGIIPGKMHDVTQNVMHEIGIDISKQYSKSYLEVPLNQMDIIITMSDLARSTIKGIQGLCSKIIHWDIEDPYHSAEDKKQLYENYRRVRDNIQKRISDPSANAQDDRSSFSG